MAVVHTTAHHASLLGAFITPGLIALLVGPAVVARLMGWGDTDAR